MITLTTTLYIDDAAISEWGMASYLDLYTDQLNPNYIVHVSEAERPALVKTLAAHVWQVGEASYLLTTVPHRRYWAILPPHVQVVAPSENNSKPGWSSLDAWVYWALGGMGLDKARARAKTPPKTKGLIEACATAWEMWEAVPVFEGEAVKVREPLVLDYETVPDLPGTLDDYIGVVMGVDIETTGLDPLVDDVIGVSVSIQPGQAWWIPFASALDSGVILTENPPKAGPERAGELEVPSPLPSSRGRRTNCPATLRAVLESPACPAVTWNGGFDWDFLNVHGIRMTPPVGDGKALAYLLGLQPLAPKLDLKPLAARLLRRQVVTYAGAVGDEDNLAGTGIDPDLLLLYAGQDADLSLTLHSRLLKMMQKTL